MSGKKHKKKKHEKKPSNIAENKKINNDIELQAENNNVKESENISESAICENNSSLPDSKPVDNKKNNDHVKGLFEEHRFDKIRHRKVVFIAVATVLLVFAIMMIAIDTGKAETINAYEKTVAALNQQLESEKELNNQYQITNSELDSKVVALSDAVALKTEEIANLENEQKQNKIPSRYPLKGTAGIVDEQQEANDELDNNEDEAIEDNYDEMSDEFDSNININGDYKGEPHVKFVTASDTTVIATALGKIEEIKEDSIFGYAIKIDHENGYYSIYRGYGIPLVDEGDIVSPGCNLMKIAEEGHEFLYQIFYEGKYIDPMSILEING